MNRLANGGRSPVRTGSQGRTRLLLLVLLVLVRGVGVTMVMGRSWMWGRVRSAGWALLGRVLRQTRSRVWTHNTGGNVGRDDEDDKEEEEEEDAKRRDVRRSR